MNTNDLIKLAHKADIEGDHELADYLDNQLIRLSAFKPFDFIKNVGKNVLDYGKNLVSKNYLPKYNTSFTSLAPDASNLNAISGTPAPFGTKAQKFFQYGTKNIARTPERLTEIGNKIKLAVINVQSDDPNVKKAVEAFKNGNPNAMTTVERNALLDHLVNKAQIAKRNNDISPDDIIKVLQGKAPDTQFKEVTTLSNFGKSLLGATGIGAAAIGTGALNQARQQASLPPGGVYQNTPAFNSMPEMGGGGGGMPQMGEMPQTGGGYQGPAYGMPTANQSFQPMQGYQPANQLPRTFDQAEPLYPRISPQQAMQNAMYVDKARRYDELTANANRPADTQIVGPGNSTPATESPLTAQDFVGQPGFGGATDAAGIAAELYADEQAQRRNQPGGVSYSEEPTQTDYLPAAPVTEGTNDPNANVIYTPETSPRTDRYDFT